VRHGTAVLRCAGGSSGPMHKEWRPVRRAVESEPRPEKTGDRRRWLTRRQMGSASAGFGQRGGPFKGLRHGADRHGRSGRPAHSAWATPRWAANGAREWRRRAGALKTAHSDAVLVLMPFVRAGETAMPRQRPTGGAVVAGAGPARDWPSWRQKACASGRRGGVAGDQRSSARMALSRCGGCQW
jgi:hypothetical protein